MLTPETRTEHEARAAAAAAKARAALTPRSTSSGQAHYDELRQKWACSRYNRGALATSILGHCSPALKTPDPVKDASHSSIRCVIDCRTQSAALQCGARAKNRSCRCP